MKDEKFWKTKGRNIPNILSVLRILLVPVFLFAYRNTSHGAHYWAAGVFALAGFTDVLDGWIARRHDLISDLGRMLDPLGDKLMTLAAVYCLASDHIIPMWALVFYALKEFVMVAGALFIHKRLRAQMPASNILGKLASGVLFAVGVTLMVVPIPRPAAEAMITAAICVAFMAFGSYILTFKSVLTPSRRERDQRK